MKYTMVLNEKQENRVKELAESLGTTKAEVLREALALFSVIVRETATRKREVQLVSKDDPSDRIVLVSPNSG